MLRTILGGIAVGIANIIPGVSGGTMMVILGIFNRLNDAVTGLFSLHNDHRLEDIKFLIQVGIGVLIGLIGFANVLNFCFEYYPTQTMFWFVGLVGFSIPVFMKSEMNDCKIHFPSLIIGMLIIFVISYLAPDKTGDVNPDFPPISIVYLIKNVFMGMIAGATMLLPGISGSMILLILGEYYLFKSLIASVLSFRLNILIPLGCYGIGILLGILCAAWGYKICVKKNKGVTLSVLLGLIIASTVVLIPLSASYDFMTILTSIGCVILGGMIVYLIEKVA